MPFTREEDFLNYVYNFITENKQELGFKYVGLGTENLLPGYPAVDVTVGKLERRLHATQQFLIEVHILLWVYHANLSVSHAIRTLEDLALVTGVVELLHSQYTGNPESKPSDFIFGYVETEDPGIASKKNGPVVTTKLEWVATGRIAFQQS